ncbi:hypothetical protein HH310_41875 [Actinoplanes sp. TBRC 11911]|uniref:AfsR/SARP family transcriptional regulator n=1 Tax=Actinoplanes sp. TBRC 11911 TaxID=2729386 RepID=UPI00145F3C46|nr:BTAD domain-containing putative transcriptional regulator [Actinoplanes sp. TBRC 11911]NMO57699.1 hypothetical protein [Actinoplanes sp. TBRC 11911]
MLKKPRVVLTVTSVFVGIPVLLALVGGSPLPGQKPSVAQVKAWLDDPLGYQYVTAILRTMVWLLWLSAAVMLMFLLTSQVGRRGSVWTAHRVPRRLRRIATSALGPKAAHDPRLANLASVTDRPTHPSRVDEDYLLRRTTVRQTVGDPPTWHAILVHNQRRNPPYHRSFSHQGSVGTERAVDTSEDVVPGTAITSPENDGILELLPGGLLSIDVASGLLVTETDWRLGDKPTPFEAIPVDVTLGGIGHFAFSSGAGLTGPGAHDAVRSLLVASLTGRDADDSDGIQILATVSAMSTLLGLGVADLPSLSQLTIPQGLMSAMTILDEEIIRRARLLEDQDAENLHTLERPHLRPLLLISHAPGPEHEQRLANLIRLGAATVIGALLIGNWPYGTTLVVNSDGTADAGGSTGRIGMLDINSAITALETMAVRLPTTGEHSTVGAIASADPPSPIASAEPLAPDGPPNVRVDQDSERVRVHVLGSPAVLDPRGEPMTGLRAKALELLVYLAVHRGGAALSDIMEALWPDAKVGRASERLSTTVANLRGVLRAAQPTTEPSDLGASDHQTTGGKPGRRRKEPIPNTGSRYHLDPAYVHVDWWTVLDAYGQLANAFDDRTQLDHLQTAISAAPAGRGLADDCDYEWIDIDREHVRRQLVKIYARAADLLSETDPAAAHRLYADACQLDPLSEKLAHRAMRTAARLKNAAGIQTRLETLRRSLNEAGVDIDPEIEQLAERLLRDLTDS